MATVPEKVPKPNKSVANSAKISVGKERSTCTSSRSVHRSGLGAWRFSAHRGASSSARNDPSAVPVTDICTVASSGARIRGAYPQSGGSMAEIRSVRWLRRAQNRVGEQSVNRAAASSRRKSASVRNQRFPEERVMADPPDGGRRRRGSPPPGCPPGRPAQRHPGSDR